MLPSSNELASRRGVAVSVTGAGTVPWNQAAAAVAEPGNGVPGTATISAEAADHRQMTDGPTPRSDGTGGGDVTCDHCDREVSDRGVTLTSTETDAERTVCGECFFKSVSATVMKK